jgi:hypothetical protein
MAFTVADVIAEARALHPQFDDRQTPDGVLLTELDNFQHELLDAVLEFDPDAFGASDDTALPLATFGDGIALPARHTDKGCEAQLGGTDQKVEVPIVPWRNRIRPGTGPSVYILEDTLYLFGSNEDWTWADQITFWYIPLPTALTAVTDTILLFPDRARQVFAGKAAQIMAARGPLDPQRPISLEYFAANYAQRAKSFLATYHKRKKAKTAYWRESW